MELNAGKMIGNAALGGLTGGVGGLVSGAIGGIGSLLGLGSRKEKKAKEAEEREHQRQIHSRNHGRSCKNWREVYRSTEKA